MRWLEGICTAVATMVEAVRTRGKVAQEAGGNERYCLEEGVVVAADVWCGVRDCGGSSGSRQW